MLIVISPALWPRNRNCPPAHRARSRPPAAYGQFDTNRHYCYYCEDYKIPNGFSSFLIPESGLGYGVSARFGAGRNYCDMTHSQGPDDTGHFLKKKVFVAAVSDPGKTTRNAFAVVVNGQGQHALWPAGLELPAAGGGSRPPCPGRPAWTPSPAHGGTSLRPASTRANRDCDPQPDQRLATRRGPNSAGTRFRTPATPDLPMSCSPGRRPAWRFGRRHRRGNAADLSRA